jgi:predicted SAM-dependent methyltransferase
MKCRVCGNADGNVTYEVREMMFGLRDRFTYFQCANCLCLQIANFPEDMRRYYPPDYTSFVPVTTRRPWLKELAVRWRNEYAVFGHGVLGALIYRRWPHPPLKSLAPLHLERTSARLLDVGSGNGHLAYQLTSLGFSPVQGVDPYVEHDITYDNGTRVLRRTIHEVEGRYDVVMFHHVFEHLADPFETLVAVHRLLDTGGTCLIRIPTASSDAWEQYRADWVNIDAPRHFFLHSRESMALLAQRAGFVVERVVCESLPSQFWASEQYRDDIPLLAPESHFTNPRGSRFTRGRIAQDAERAAKLNKEGRGDWIVVYLRKQ